MSEVPLSDVPEADLVKTPEKHAGEEEEFPGLTALMKVVPAGPAEEATR